MWSCQVTLKSTPTNRWNISEQSAGKRTSYSIACGLADRIATSQYCNTSSSATCRATSRALQALTLPAKKFSGHRPLSSSASKLLPHTLTDPDVNLSIHPALMVQPPPSRSIGQTTQAAGIGSPTSMPRLALDVWKETYISSAPNAPVPHQRIAAPAAGTDRDNGL
jgi:hypothetical protein